MFAEMLRKEFGYTTPIFTDVGPSVIAAADVARKRYVQSAGNIYGIYCGLKETIFRNLPVIFLHGH